MVGWIVQDSSRPVPTYKKCASRIPESAFVLLLITAN
jgi:hypothetical protein